MISCRKHVDPPIAGFTVEVTGEFEVGKEVRFINESSNAVSYNWEFGDGYTSTEADPIYVYNSTGTFTVILTATGEDGDEDQAEFTIEVLIPTLLVVEVRDIDDETIVYVNASVLLYEALSDWETGDPANSLYEGITNNSGITVFANLDPYVYYVDALAGDYNNWILGLDFIRTPEVMPNEINWFVAWVEYNPGSKGMARGSARMVPKAITRKEVPELTKQVAAEKWKELYDMRVK